MFKIVPFRTSRNARDVVKKMFTYEKTNSKLGALAHNVSFSTCINVGKIFYKLFFVNFFASLFSIDKIARSYSLSCDIVYLRYVFISFNFEIDLSADVTVTCKVTKSVNSLYISGKDELKRLWSMRLLTSSKVFVTAISFLNSVANDLISESNSSVKSFGYFPRITRTALSSMSGLSVARLLG